MSSYFDDTDIPKMSEEFMYSGRDPFRERLDFERKHGAGSGRVKAAKVLGFMMGYRGTNGDRILLKTVQITKWKDALAKLGFLASQKAEIIKFATMYPEMIAIGQLNAGHHLVTPFCKFVEMAYGEWLIRSRAFLSLTNQGEANVNRFLTVATTVWAGIDKFWAVLLPRDKANLHQLMVAAINVEIVADGGLVAPDYGDPTKYSAAAKAFLASQTKIVLPGIAHKAAAPAAPAVATTNEPADD